MSEHWAAAVIRQFEDAKYFGSLELKFRDGRIVMIEEKRTLLPPKSTEEPRG